MAEGLLAPGGTIGSGIHDDPDSPPAPAAEAPRGYTWNRKSRAWAPRQRGPVLFREDASGPAATQAEAHGTSGATAGPDARDPEPGWMRDDDAQPDGKRGGKLSYSDVPAAVKGDIAGMMGLVGTPVLAMLQSADPYCGGALAQSFEGIVDATLPLMCRSQKIVDYFSGDKSDWLLWGKLAMALAPVGRAIVEHHVTHTVALVKNPKTGAVQVVRQAPGGPGQGDPLVPPQPDPASYPA